MTDRKAKNVSTIRLESKDRTMDKSVFEAWAREKGFDIQRSKGCFTTYEDVATEMYWECWCAALRSKNQEIEKIANLKAQVNALKDENAGLRLYIEHL